MSIYKFCFKFWCLSFDYTGSLFCFDKRQSSLVKIKMCLLDSQFIHKLHCVIFVVCNNVFAMISEIQYFQQPLYYSPWDVMIHGVPVKTYNALQKSYYCTIIIIQKLHCVFFVVCNNIFAMILEIHILSAELVLCVRTVWWHLLTQLEL